jgi:dephospho-CoA kinase
MLKIGLTGSQGSRLHDVGKSFEKMTIDVFNADIQVKWLLNYDVDVVESVKSNFGDNYVISGFINPLAFDNDDKFNKLLDLIEYPLFESFDRFVKKHQDRCYVIFLSSIIFERNWQNRFDSVVNVFKPKEDRISLLSAVTGRNILSTYDLFQNEFDDLDKNRLSDFVIHDYLDEKQLRKQIISCDDMIIDLYFSKEKQKTKKDIVNSDLIKNIYA